MNRWKPILWPAILIVVTTIWVYSPAMRGDWLWDDKELIGQNEVIVDPHGLWRIWSDPGSLIDYYPILSSVEWIEWHLFHDATWSYHLVTLALHLAGAFLVWRLLAKLGLRFAWLGGLIFAIHPAQVESVAWIAELKNTLSLPPLLLAMCAYVDFDEKRRLRDYFLALGLFVVAMLCKTTMVMFPFVILLYAWWKRGRLSLGDCKASAPFFAVSIVLGYVSYWFQQVHAIHGHDVVVGGPLSRLALAGTSATFYLGKCIWPVEMLPVYPKWTIDPPSALQILPWLALVGIVAVCWINHEKWGRHALLGLGFFLINLVPFIGPATAFYMSFSWVLDHVLYIPIIGLIGLTVAILGTTYEQSSLRPGVVAFIAGACAFMAWESHAYAGKFINPTVLWTYTLEHNPEAWPAHVNIGNYVFNLGRVDEAMEHYRYVIRTNPLVDTAYNNLGNGYQKEGQYAEAIQEYQHALELSPGFEQAQIGWALALIKTGKLDDAVEHYKLALEIKPGDKKARLELANLLLRAGRAAEASEQFEKALGGDSHFNQYRDDAQKASPPPR